VASTTSRDSMVLSYPVSTSWTRVSQPVRVRWVESARCFLRTFPFGEDAITSFIARPTKARNSPARRKGTVPFPASTNSLVIGWFRRDASSLSGGPARQSAKVKPVLSELMHHWPMVPAPTALPCSTMVTPSFNNSARRPCLCAASKGASPPGPPPTITTPVRPKLNVTCFGVSLEWQAPPIKVFSGGWYRRDTLKPSRPQRVRSDFQRVSLISRVRQPTREIEMFSPSQAACSNRKIRAEDTYSL
jgi:hypothetical protein